jgi:hypothetical protein
LTYEFIIFSAACSGTGTALPMVTGLFIPEIAPVVKYSAPTFAQDFFRARAKAPKVVF